VRKDCCLRCGHQENNYASVVTKVASQYPDTPTSGQPTLHISYSRPLTHYPPRKDESTIPPMVSMTFRHSETESTDPDIRMAYQSITLQGSLNWSAFAPLSRSFLLAHFLKIGSFLLMERSVSCRFQGPERRRLSSNQACLQWSPALKLIAAGSHGLPELKQCIAQSEQSIFFAFLRVFVDGVSCFTTITYIPEGTSGLRRGAHSLLFGNRVILNIFCRHAARTSVTGRTVQSWFKVRPPITMCSTPSRSARRTHRAHRRL
jgi:hypothetical protein